MFHEKLTLFDCGSNLTKNVWVCVCCVCVCLLNFSRINKWVFEFWVWTFHSIEALFIILFSHKSNDRLIYLNDQSLEVTHSASNKSCRNISFDFFFGFPPFGLDSNWDNIMIRAHMCALLVILIDLMIRFAFFFFLFVFFCSSNVCMMSERWSFFVLQRRENILLICYNYHII